MSLAERRWLRLFTLCVLYVAQGIPWGFMATTLPAYLVKHEVEDIGLVLAMTTLPYSFKWVWGPLVDAFTIPRLGRRRPWILFAQGMMALTIFAMVTFDVTRELQLLVQMVFVHTVFNSLQDVAVDALAVDLLPDDERGRANGLMYGSKYAGGALGGFGMAWLITHFSLRVALSTQAAVLVLIMLVPLFVRESDAAPPKREPARVIGGALLQAFSLRSTLAAAVLMLGATFASGMIVVAANKLFVGELHWDVDEYTKIGGGWGLMIGCAFAAVTGTLTDKVGRRRVAAIASCGLALGWLAAAMLKPYWSEPWLVYALGFYSEACLATWSVALIAMCMDLSWPRIAGSQFTAYMALTNVSTTFGYQFAEPALAKLGFQGLYIAAAIVQIAVTLLLMLIDPTEARRKLPLARARPLGIAAVLALLAFLIIMTIRAILQVF